MKIVNFGIKVVKIGDIHEKSLSAIAVSYYRTPGLAEVLNIYSGGNWKVYEYCFMKQKCQLQMGTAQHKNAATPLRTSGIHTT